MSNKVVYFKMKPKSEIQKKVVELSSRLSKINEAQTKHAYDNCLNSYFVRSRQTLYCLECGHHWKDKAILVSTLTGCECPKCNKRLKSLATYKRFNLECEYYGIITSIQGMQVVRIFLASKTCKKKKEASYFIEEVMQHWIDTSGRIVTLSKAVRGFSYCYDLWVSSSNLEIRTPTYNAGLRSDINPFKIFPKMNIIPILKRNGYKGSFCKLAPHKLFSFILTNNYAETLIKTSQNDMLKYLYENPTIVKENWGSIKICIRNNYKIKDSSLWFDYLNLLKYFNRDVLNPIYVCPKNLKKAHDKLVEKKKTIDKKRRLAEMREKIDDEQKEYQREKQMFFGLRFVKGNIVIKPLENVEEFMIEGEDLGHCVYSSEYYKKKDSLVLSASVNNKKMETIEISLNRMAVIQCRGAGNKKSKYHEEIMDLIKKNIQQISRLQQSA